MELEEEEGRGKEIDGARGRSLLPPHPRRTRRTHAHRLPVCLTLRFLIAFIWICSVPRLPSTHSLSSCLVPACCCCSCCLAVTGTGMVAVAKEVEEEETGGEGVSEGTSRLGREEEEEAADGVAMS